MAAKYKVVNKNYHSSFRKKKLESYVVFESDDLKDCEVYVKKHKLPKSRIIDESGRIAIGDWYGAEDSDLGWEYD